MSVGGGMDVRHRLPRAVQYIADWELRLLLPLLESRVFCVGMFLCVFVFEVVHACSCFLSVN